MTKLFEEWRIGPLTMANRIVRAATTETLCTKGGAPSKRMCDMYRGLMRGGVKLIITGYAYVTPDGKASDRSVSMCDDAVMDDLRALVDAVHTPEEVQAEALKLPSLDDLRTGKADTPKVAPRTGEQSGSRIVAQLVYGGSKSKLAADDPRRIADAAEGQPNVDIIGPSAVAHPATGLVPREATADDIARVVKAFASAAARAKRAGFDGVEVHAAHGYLLSQFLDGRFNKRTDGYGATLEGRARLAVECVKAIRAQVGPDFPVFVKLNSCDVLGDVQGSAGGLSEEDSLRVAQWLVDAGASCLEVSGDWHAVDIEDISGEPFFGAFGTRLARRVDVPIIVTGGWRDRDTVERYLETTDIAGIGMARPLICEPYLPELWQSDYRDVAECTSCDFCLKNNGIPCVLRKGK